MNFVDGIAMVLPWAGGLVPATLTYRNLVLSGLDWWQAAIVAAIVEGLGFVAVTTTLDYYELGNMRSFILISGAATCLYLIAVIIINVFLDPSATQAQQVVGGILSTFGLLGGIMVALRNQLGKMRHEHDVAASRERQEKVEQEENARREREREWQLKAEQDRIALQFQQQMQAEQLRQAHELALEKARAADERKMEKARAESTRKVSGEAEKSPDVSGDDVNPPNVYRRFSDVSPDDYAWIADAPVRAIVERYHLGGKDPERTARSWKMYARERR